MKKIFLTTVIFFSCQFVNAANDVDKWNNPVSKEIRKAHSDGLAQTTYREISTKNASVSPDLKTVYPQIESKAAVGGAKSKVVAEAILEVDPNKVAKDWNKKLQKYGKYGLGALGVVQTVGLIIDGIMSAADWVLDPANNQIIHKNGKISDDPNHPTVPSYYYVPSLGGAKASSKLSACQKGTDSVRTYLNHTESGGTFGHGSCQYYLDGNQKDTQWHAILGGSNPNYDSNVQPEKSPVTEKEIDDKIKDVLTNPQNKDLAKEMIKQSYGSVEWSNDPGSRVEIFGDVTNKQKDIVNSDDPVSDGHTTSTPTVTDGKTGSGTSKNDGTNTGTTTGNSTTTNPDGSTSTTTSTSTSTTTTTTENKFEFELPAFCDWASTVCEWIGWTKEEPELEDTPLVIEEQTPVTYQHQEHIRFGQSCPFFPEMAVLPMGVLGEIKFMKDLTFICDWGLIARPYIIGLGYLGSLMFLLYGIRNGNA